MTGWLAGWLAGWLTGWLAGHHFKMAATACCIHLCQLDSPAPARPPAARLPASKCASLRSPRPDSMFARSAGPARSIQGQFSPSLLHGCASSAACQGSRSSQHQCPVQRSQASRRQQRRSCRASTVCWQDHCCLGAAGLLGSTASAPGTQKRVPHIGQCSQQPSARHRPQAPAPAGARMPLTAPQQAVGG